MYIRDVDRGLPLNRMAFALRRNANMYPRFKQMHIVPAPR